jgi:pimeloyl-ACP methyl ester carboxylesterase
MGAPPGDIDDTACTRVEVEGVGLACHVEGSGPAVLMTHGFASSSHMFAANAEALAADHTVVTWDLRGHGGSDSPDDATRYSIASALGDMLALLDHVGADRAVLVGHSLGGYLSLAFHAARPERVRALVLVGTGPGFRKEEARRGWNDMAERFAEGFDRRGLDAHRGSDEFDPSVHRHGGAGLARAARGILTQHDSSVIDSLPRIGVPTLVVVGERDDPFVAGSRYMADKIPGASLVVVPGAGHAPNVSHRREFDSTLRAFLDRVEATR